MEFEKEKGGREGARDSGGSQQGGGLRDSTPDHAEYLLGTDEPSGRKSFSSADLSTGANPPFEEIGPQASNLEGVAGHGMSADLVHLAPVESTHLPPHVPSFQPASSAQTPISPNLIRVLPHVLTFTQRPYDYLERKIAQYRRRLRMSVMFHSSSPLSILLRRPAVAIVFLLLASMILYFTFESYHEKQRPIESQAYRFTPLELRSSTSVITSPNVARFAVLQERGSCLEEVAPEQTYSENEHLYALFPDKTRMDGFAITTSAGPPDLDPARFIVSAQDPDGAWHEVGSPLWNTLFSGHRIRVNDRVELSVVRGESFQVDFRLDRDWPWMIGRLGSGVALALGLALAGVAGLLRTVRRVGAMGLVLFWAAGAVCMLVAGAAGADSGRWREAAMWLSYAGVIGGGAAALGWRERRLRAVLLSTGALLLLADVVAHTVLFSYGVERNTRGSGSVRHGLTFMLLATAMLLGALWLALLSLSHHHAVSSLLAQDRAALAQAWLDLRARRGVEEALQSLQQAVEAAAVCETARAGLAQRQRILVQGGRGVGADGAKHESMLQQCLWRLEHAWTAVQACVLGAPHEGWGQAKMRSLDQIYAQAICLRPLLRSKVQAWAAETGGMFPTLDGAFVKWSEAQRDPSQQDCVVWNDLKRESRTIEKVIRCYGEDVARVVDVCRQAIVFATVGDLARCFETIANDDAVELLRVKNGMGLQLDGRGSAGFRSVSVNLRVTDEDARSLGVDSHVCEVQLLLRDFANLQMEAGRHERYLAFRDYNRPDTQLRHPWARWLLDQISAARMLKIGGGRELPLQERPHPWAHRHAAALNDSFSLRASVPGRRWASGYRSGTEGSSGGAPTHALGSGMRTTESRTDHGSDRSLLHSVASTSASLVYDFSRTPTTGELFSNMSCSRLNLARRLPAAATPFNPDVMLAFQDLIHRRNTSSKGKKGHLRDFWSAMEHVSASSVLFIRHPLQGALSKRLWRGVALGIAAFGLLMTNGVLFSRVFIGNSFKTYRFTALAIRAWTPEDFGAVPAESHGIAAFGAATRGCPVHDRVERMQGEGSSMTVVYAHEVWMDGFWFRTRNDTAQLDPIRFLVEGSSDGLHWTTVGSSSVKDARFFGIHYTDDVFYTPRERNEMVVQHIGGWARSTVIRVVKWQTPVPTLLGILLASIRAASGNLNNRWVVGGGLLATYVALLVVVPLEWMAHGWQEALLWLLTDHFFLVIGLTVVFRQHLLMRFAFVGIAAAMFLRILFKLAVMQTGFPADGPLAMMGLVGLVGLLAGLIRVNILWRSREVVREDQRQYDELWARVSVECAEEIRGLEALTRQHKREENKQVRHYYHPFLVSLQGRALDGDRRGLVPIKDIDQIYAQATCLHPILQSKVQAWAAETGGMFPTLDGAFVKWSDVREDPHARATVKWGQVKNEARAIEKVIRCYGEDVSRVVDVCRQAIVFATVGDLARCFETIANDDAVELLRVKNRMALQFDGKASAGFRNVSMNVRMREEAARSLGVDTHVCEVQLLLRDFANLQKAQGHKRYVHFRNVRGE